MNKKLDVKDFELTKVKFNAKKGLEIDWFDLQKTNDLYHVSSDSAPSEDYLNKLEEFKEIFAYSLGLNNGWDFSREHNRKNDEDLKSAMNYWLDEIERCHVTGIVVVGAGETKGIKIMGSLETDLGTVGLTSPLIRFTDSVTNCNDMEIPIGGNAEDIFKELQIEVWSFIYQSKRGGELFPAEEMQSGLDGVVKMSKVG